MFVPDHMSDNRSPVHVSSDVYSIPYVTYAALRTIFFFIVDRMPFSAVAVNALRKTPA